MCGCAHDRPCPYHAEQIMVGLAAVRDLSDRGDKLAADLLMRKLRDSHGDAKVDLVVAEVRDGRLDLSQYGTPYPRSN